MKRSRFWLSSLFGLTGLLCTAALFAACADEETDPNAELKAYFAETFGLYLFEWAEDSEQFAEDEDGFLVALDDGFVAIDGFDVREMRIEERIQPAAAGGEVFLKVIDVETGLERYFLYDFDERYVVFGEDTSLDESRGVGVQANPDGTYEVWTFDDAVSDRTEVETVPDGYAAMQRADAVNRFSALPPHMIMLAFALGHTTTPEARTTYYHATDTNYAMKIAATPSACSLFKTFCDCVACRALERSGECDLCPDL